MVILDLPMPVSTNRIWQMRGVSRSPAYKAWTKQADRLVMATRLPGAMPHIDGPFAAHIVLDGTRRRIDIDNHVKCVLDYAQRIEVISNDRNCQRLLVEWGATAHGCRLELRET